VDADEWDALGLTLRHGALVAGHSATTQRSGIVATAGFALLGLGVASFRGLLLGPDATWTAVGCGSALLVISAAMIVAADDNFLKGLGAIYLDIEKKKRGGRR